MTGISEPHFSMGLRQRASLSCRAFLLLMVCGNTNMCADVCNASLGWDSGICLGSAGAPAWRADQTAACVVTACMMSHASVVIVMGWPGVTVVCYYCFSWVPRPLYCPAEKATSALQKVSNGSPPEENGAVLPHTYPHPRGPNAQNSWRQCRLQGYNLP